MVGDRRVELRLSGSQDRRVNRLPRLRVGLAGIGPAASRPPAGRSATDLQPVKSAPRESDPVSLRPERSGFPSSSKPVEVAGIEPARQRLQGATATSAVTPEGGACGPTDWCGARYRTV